MAERLLVRIAEAAAMLDVSETSLYELIAQGRIPVIGVGSGKVRKNMRVPVDALRAWIARETEHGEQEAKRRKSGAA